MTNFLDTPRGAGRPATLNCSFCGKDKDSVIKLVAGPGVYICNECIDLCNEILASGPTPHLHGWHDLSDDDLLANLTRTQAALPQLESTLHEHVELLRSRGISWTRIGAALGVSKQAAWERFSGED